MFSLQIVCNVQTCYDGKCDTNKCGWDSEPYKSRVILKMPEGSITVDECSKNAYIEVSLSLPPQYVCKKADCEINIAVSVMEGKQGKTIKCQDTGETVQQLAVGFSPPELLDPTG